MTRSGLFALLVLAALVGTSVSLRVELQVGLYRRWLDDPDEGRRRAGAERLAGLGPRGVAALEAVAFGDEPPGPARQSALDVLSALDARGPVPAARLFRYLLEARGLARDGPLRRLEALPPAELSGLPSGTPLADVGPTGPSVNGFRLFTDAGGLAHGYALSPRPGGARLAGDFRVGARCHRFGLASELPVPPGAAATLAFSWRATSSYDRSQVTNATVEVGGLRGPPRAERLVGGGTTDTGPRRATLALSSSDLARARFLSVTVSLDDCWSADWNQTLEVWDVELRPE